MKIGLPRIRANEKQSTEICVTDNAATDIVIFASSAVLLTIIIYSYNIRSDMKADDLLLVYYYWSILSELNFEQPV